MKSLAKLTLLMMIAVSYASGQSNKGDYPNFSGIWELNPAASKIPGFDFKASEKPLLEVSFIDPVFRTVIKSKQGDKYVETSACVFYTDGRGETNQSDKDGTNESVASKTKWDGKKLVRVFADNSPQKEKKEEWAISNDGKRLTQKIITTWKYTTSFQINGKEVDSKTIKDKLEILFVFDRLKTPS